jgi:hypothetical protein
MQVDFQSGEHELVLRYDPTEVKAGLALSLLSFIILILVLTGIRMFRIPGITTRGGLDAAEPAG